jgi:hypothetical protein
MKTILVILLFYSSLSFTQQYQVENVSGTVKAQIGSSENWIDLKKGMELPPHSTILTDKNSSVALKNDQLKFTLEESSALSVNSIKKMSLDDLLLALAMEDMMNAPRKKEENKSKSTQVYGNPNNSKTNTGGINDQFGLARLNGAMQLKENGFTESAIITAKETFRKYPETKKLIDQRIFFANLLYEKGLYEEAYADFSSFKNYEMTEKEKEAVNSKLEFLSKKIISR